ncbi:MAG TPA: hypothetical protein PKD20_01925 [Candidatus Saccharibacteria bacterium]|jgi:hypothetical protein|nr:hypothetical protein [Candidatus Saccharibacteria bacterium]HMT55617.1 hypothetical protein [Candidatus Saccharibacteria bacterium]
MNDFSFELDSLMAARIRERLIEEQQSKDAEIDARIQLEKRVSLHMPIVSQIIQDVAVALPRLRTVKRHPLFTWEQNKWYLMSHIGEVIYTPEKVTYSNFIDNNNGYCTQFSESQITVRKIPVTSIFLDEQTGELVSATDEIKDFANKDDHYRSRGLDLATHVSTQATPDQIVPVDRIDPSIDNFLNQPILVSYRDRIKSILLNCL